MISELNSKYEGPPFLMYSRYAITIANIFMTMIFAPGIPVLIPLCFFQCGILYWCDKYLFVSHYKKPADLGHHINRRVFDILYWAALFYVAFALWIYTSSNIYPSSVSTVSLEVAGQFVLSLIGKSTGFFKRITSSATMVLLIAALLILAINILKIFIGFLIYVFSSCCKKLIKPYVEDRKNFRDCMKLNRLNRDGKDAYNFL